MNAVLQNVTIHGEKSCRTLDIEIEHDKILSISQHDSAPTGQSKTIIDGSGALVTPTLCHPHLHLDKAFLLGHPKYADMKIEKGDFEEAMKLTSNAKAQFEPDDLQERGQRVIDESIRAGVTHMRGFVELDAGVGTKCLDAGIALQRDAARRGNFVVQLCAFAQLPLFSAAEKDKTGEVIRSLMLDASRNQAVDAIGSTPYVEDDRSRMEQNVDWMIDLSISRNLHLDFHLDYNLDQSIEPLVFYVVNRLKETNWKDRTTKRTVVLGHCTRFALFDDATWERLAADIKLSGTPIHFIGLPTSDLFMMGKGSWPELRGTLNIPTVIQRHGLNGCIGINNIGNAFTPYGSCDPLSLASQCVGIYQAGTASDAELLFQCVSTRAKAAIGVTDNSNDMSEHSLRLRKGDSADLLIFGAEHPRWRTRTSISSVVYLYDSGRGRRALLNGRPTTSLTMLNDVPVI